MAEYRYRDTNLDIVWTSDKHKSDSTAIQFVGALNIILSTRGTEVAYVEAKKRGWDGFKVLRKIKDISPQKEAEGEPA